MAEAKPYRDVLAGVFQKYLSAQGYTVKHSSKKNPTCVGFFIWR